MAGALKRIEREQMLSTRTAHLTATLSRINPKKFPTLATLLKKTDPKRKVAQTWQQQLAIAYQWHHRLGGARLRNGKE